MSAKKGFFKLVGISFISYPLSFFNQILLSYYFGATAEMDAYWVSMAAINLLVVFMAPARDAMIPLFFSAYAADKTAGERYFGAKLNLMLLFCLASTGLALLWPQGIASLVISPGQEAILEQVGRFMVLLSPLIFLMPLAEVMGSLLISFKRYLFQHLGRIFGTLGSITALVLLAERWGIFALVAGALGGWLLLWGLQIKELNKIGFHFYLTAKPRAEAAFVAMGSSLIVGHLLSNLYLVYANRALTFFGPGWVSSYQYGMSLSQIPQNILVVALITVLWPKILDQVEAQDWSGIYQLTLRSARHLSLVLVGISVLCWVFSRPVIYLIYARGAFDDRALELTDLCFRALSVAIIPAGLTTLFSRVLVTLKLAKAHFWASLANGLSGVTFLWLALYFQRVDWAVYHMTVATSLNLCLSTVLLLGALKNQQSWADWGRGMYWLARLLLAALVVWYLFPLIPIELENKFLVTFGLAWQSLAALALFGALVLGLKVVQFKEIRELLGKGTP